MKELTRQITRVVIMPKGEPIFSEYAHSVEIEDDAAGQFIKVSTGADCGTISFDCEDWPALRKEIDGMVASANKYNAGLV